MALTPIIPPGPPREREGAEKKGAITGTAIIATSGSTLLGHWVYIGSLSHKGSTFQSSWKEARSVLAKKGWSVFPYF